MSLPNKVHFEIPTEDIDAVPSILVNQHENRLSQAFLIFFWAFYNYHYLVVQSNVSFDFIYHWPELAYRNFLTSSV